MDGAKVIPQNMPILANFGHFGEFLTPLDPLGLPNQNFSRAKNTKIIFILTLLMFFTSFKKIKWINQMLWVQKCHFGHFRG